MLVCSFRRFHVPKKKNIGFNRATIDALREGDNERQEMRESISRKDNVSRRLSAGHIR
jgi:hypothetical protein